MSENEAGTFFQHPASLLLSQQTEGISQSCDTLDTYLPTRGACLIGPIPTQLIPAATGRPSRMDALSDRIPINSPRPRVGSDGPGPP